jgi:osmotically-inducible protein OsmY
MRILMIKKDSQLRREVEFELRWDPKVNAAQISVTVDDGAVSLLGAVDTRAEVEAAEDAVKRVGGVRNVTAELKVKIFSDLTRPDAHIAAAVASALEWNVLVPSTVSARVHDGWVTVEGQCVMNYQRRAAESTIRYLAGVVGVSNCISLNARALTPQVKSQVVPDLQRRVAADASST